MNNSSALLVPHQPLEVICPDSAGLLLFASGLGRGALFMPRIRWIKLV